MSELKIKIKEVTQEEHPLSLGQQAIVSVVKGSEIYDRYTTHFVEECKDWMDSVGCISSKKGIGVFRKETIRDATLNECVCWYDIQSWTAHTKNHGLSVTPYPASIQKKLNELKGKEIILELVE